MLEFFDNVNFALTGEIFANLPPTELFKVNEIIKPSFEKNFGEKVKIFSYIFTQMHNLRAKYMISNQRVNVLENKLKELQK